MNEIVGIVGVLLLVARKGWYLLFLGLSLGLLQVDFLFVPGLPKSWASHHMVCPLMVPLMGFLSDLSALLQRISWEVIPMVAAFLGLHIAIFLQVAELRRLDQCDGTKEEMVVLASEPAFAAEGAGEHSLCGVFFEDSVFGPPAQVAVWKGYQKSPEIVKLAAETGRRVGSLPLQSDPKSKSMPEELGWKLRAVSSSGVWES